MNKEKVNKSLFNRKFIFITCINLMVYIIYYFLTVTVGNYAKRNLVVSTSQAGLAIGIYIIGTLLARLYMGKKIEIIGRKQIFRFGTVMFFLTTALYLFANNIYVLDFIRFFNGVAYGSLSSAINVIVTQYIPERRRGEGINYFGISTSLAAAIGPFTGMFLIPILKFKEMIIIMIVMSAVIMVLSFCFKVNNIELSEEEIRRANKISFDSFFEEKVLFISFIGFLMGLGYSSILSFLPLYSAELGMAKIGAFFFIVYAICMTLSRPITGKIFDKYGENYVMYPSFLFTTISFVMIAYMSNNIILLLSGALMGLGFGTFMSNGQALTLKLADKKRVGVAMSTYFIGLDLGIGIGPYLLGSFESSIGFKGLYIICALLTIFIIFLYLFFYKLKSVKY